MWNLKFKLLNKDSVYTLISKNTSVTDFMYPIDYYTKNNKVFILGVHLLRGRDEEKKKFIREFKKDKKVKQFKVEGDQIISLIGEEEQFYKKLFSPEFYHPAPVMIKEGYEVWSIAAWERKPLEDLMGEILKWKDKLEGFELLNLGKMQFDEIYFPKMIPDLPEKQRKAFRLAMKRGYYTWPRKVDLKDLAKEAGVSIPTFQENLRKAEAKLMPFFAEGIKFSEKE